MHGRSIDCARPGMPAFSKSGAASAVCFRQWTRATNAGTWMNSSAMAMVYLRSPTYRASRAEEHTSEIQSLMRLTYAVLCLKKKKEPKQNIHHIRHSTQSYSHP